jgi:hypothetical protein
VAVLLLRWLAFTCSWPRSSASSGRRMHGTSLGPLRVTKSFYLLLLLL